MTKRMHLQLKIICAGNGDALLVHFKGTDNKYHNILIDGGNAKAYPSNLKNAVKEIIDNKHHEQRIDLVVVTHIDIDHIKGIIRLVSDIKNREIGKDKKNIIKKFWFNCNALIKREEYRLDTLQTCTGVRDGVTLERYLQEQEVWEKQQSIVRPDKYQGNKGTQCIGGAMLTILSPSREFLKSFHDEAESKWDTAAPFLISARERYQDYDVPIDKLIKMELEKSKNNLENKDTDKVNGSSIAFLFEYLKKKILFLGDAHHSQIVDSLSDMGYFRGNRLAVDYVKLSHHGSRTGTSFDLLEMVECRNFIISTDGCNHNLPHKAVLAKILGHPGRDGSKKINFIFNYPKSNYTGNGLYFNSQERKKYNFSCLFGSEYGYDINLIE